MSADVWKRAAAEKALEFVLPGMKLGLGTGSTAAHFVDLLGERVSEGLDVVGVPTSEATRQQAEALSIPLATLDELPFLDLTVDGADELDDRLRLIKGGGGALLREKIVATTSEQMIVIADFSKRVDRLGSFPLPVEVLQFGLRSTMHLIEVLSADAGCYGEIAIRKSANGEPFVTDNGNFIADCSFNFIEDPEALDEALKFVPGVVEHGLFLGIADHAILAGPNGVKVISAEIYDSDDDDDDEGHGHSHS